MHIDGSKRFHLMLLQLFCVCAQRRKDRSKMLVANFLEHSVPQAELQLDQHLLLHVRVQLGPVKLHLAASDAENLKSFGMLHLKFVSNTLVSYRVKVKLTSVFGSSHRL